jgi:hypothetical protein
MDIQEFMADTVYVGYFFFDGMAFVAGLLLASLFKRSKEPLIVSLYWLFRVIWIVYGTLMISDLFLLIKHPVPYFDDRWIRGIFIRGPVTLTLLWLCRRMKA